MNERKLVYVCSGELAVKLEACGPTDAICKAMQRQEGQNLTLDSHYVYIDERGFRQDETAQWRVPIEQALTLAGYVFDED